MIGQFKGRQKTNVYGWVSDLAVARSGFNQIEVKPVLRVHSIGIPKLVFNFQNRLLLNADQKYCIVLQWKHSAILSTFIKLQFAIKIFVLSILSGRLKQVLLYWYTCEELTIWRLSVDQSIQSTFP